MSKEIYISSTPHETRLAIVENDALTEIYYERENEYTLAGSIYNGRVTRVLPGMQSSFVDIGLERDAFLYITDFMEEVPDAAEFDTSSNGDRPSGDRAPRLNGGDQPAEGARSSERSGRGRRGSRDRGGRDRSADPARQTSGGRNEAPRPGADAPESAAAAGIPAESAEAGDVGEGAPGADGSRRWRGRRGRRRGRGSSAQPGDQPSSSAPSSTRLDSTGSDSGPDSDDGETIFEGGASFDDSAPMDVEGSAPQGSTAERAQSTPREPRGSRQEAPRSDAPRRDRGRDRGRNDRNDQSRDQRPDRPQRVPRSFAPSHTLYGVDSGEASASRSTGPIANAYGEADPAAEPIILPGESLSKYRKGEHDAAPAAGKPAADATPITLATPANLYTVAAGWDGGAVLPGETLSRRRPADSRPESRDDSSREPRRDFQRDSSRDAHPGREGRGTRDARPDRNNRDDRSPRAETRRDDRSSFRNDAPAAAPIAAQPAPEFSAPLSQAAPADAPAIHTTSVPPPPIPTAEYEPSEASASYRVDPLPRSEYRQAASVLEPPPATPAEAEVEAAAAEAHDITSISSTGEMHSEHLESTAEPTPHPAQTEVPEPSSPIRHEGAVVSSQPDFDPQQPPLPTPQPAGGFAPGSGQLTEEVLDEEEFSGALHASSIEEIDDLDEEETLEGAADLGTMLREMSIDNITRTSPTEEDEDDDELEEDELDEDDLEEDEDDEQGRLGEELEEAEASEESDSDEDFEEQAARGDAADHDSRAQSAPGAEGERTASTPARTPGRDSERRPGRRDGRRSRGDRSGRSDRPRSTGGSGDQERGRSGNGRGRHSAQSTNLPAISDLLKPGQEILVQIAKEPIAKKGARITSHIALPGRFLVFMPTVNHTGVSRKIESDAERRRLKEILLSEKGDASGGFIVRTAASGASEEELRSDLRFLLNLWADIKARSESSKSPALIYHDLNLIERILRDQVTDNFSAIWVDTDTEYERVLRFLQRFQPSLIRRVKLYTKETPLFEQFGITEEINKALRSKVWLKSGGSIVINQTEALVAIDINTGKYVGKTARLEDTIVKTNLDAIPEIVRQIRLRDLGGIIIIDFIDMDERRNRNRVMAALEDELKNDRAPSKVLQFNDFGLVAITRKRVKQSLERTLSTTCNVCVGTGMVKSPITVCNDIFVEMKKMHRHLERGDVMLRVHPEVVKQLKTSGSKWLQEMEEMAGKTILVKSDPSLHPEQFDIH
jgi:ribonuclease G